MNDLKETLGLMKQALASGELLAKATFNQPSTATTGLQTYDLEAPAKNLYPVLTPLRNLIPRVSGKGGIQANWRAVTAINSTPVLQGVAEGRRGGSMNITTKEYLAAYRTLGQESDVTFEAELSAEGFDDLKARAVMSLLQAQMIDEERVLLGGNANKLLGTTPTPSMATATTGGALAATTSHRIICVALTYDGYRLNAGATTGITQTYSRTNADATTETVNGGTAIASTAGAVTTGATSTNTITGTVAPVRGAFGYAWFVGTSAGTERFAAVTRLNTYTHTTAVPSTTQLASALAATDYSTNALIHDGLFGFIADSANGSYYNALAAGGQLTGDGTSGITEFDTALQWFWDNLRLSPTAIWVSSQEAVTIRKRILGGGTSASTARFTFNMQQGQIVGGGQARGYTNPFVMGGQGPEIPINLHPDMPAGTVLFTTDTLPYQMNNVTNVMQVRCRKDYFQMEWPLRTRKYEYGVYSDQVLQHYFPPSLGMITNITAG